MKIYRRDGGYFRQEVDGVLVGIGLPLKQLNCLKLGDRILSDRPDEAVPFPSSVGLKEGIYIYVRVASGGAGRPAGTDRIRYPVTLFLEPELAEWMDSQPNKAGAIRHLIIKELGDRP